MRLRQMMRRGASRMVGVADVEGMRYCNTQMNPVCVGCSLVAQRVGDTQARDYTDYTGRVHKWFRLTLGVEGWPSLRGLLSAGALDLFEFDSGHQELYRSSLQTFL